MGRFRELKRTKLRPTVHAVMSDAAFLFSAPYDPAVGHVAITVRVHDRFHQQGDLKGTNFNYVEMEDDSPSGIFWMEELILVGISLKSLEGKIISFEPHRIYQIGAVKPRDDQTVTAQLSILKSIDTVGFPLP